MQIRTIVIEDEHLALKKLVSFVSRISYIEVLKTFDNAIDAISYLKQNEVDLIFLDIQMEEFTGIQFLETITQRPRVIVTTAYDKYALKGYELDVFDYLLKPFTFDRFAKSVEKVYKDMSTKAEVFSNDYIFVKTEYRLEKIKIDEILYIEGQSEYLRLVMVDKKVMIKQNFKSMEVMLPKTNFVRVHKSFIVALDKIESIERNRITMLEKLIPISDSYKNGFYEAIGVLKT